MKNFVLKNWHKYSNLGVKEHYSISIQKRIILSNQIAIVAFAALFLMSVSYILKDFYFNFFSILNFISIFSILTVPYMNKKGWYKISSIIMSILTPVLTLIMATLTKKYVIENDITSYFFGRILLMSQLVVPLILIDYNRKFTLIIILSINLLSIFLFDEFHKLFNLDVFQLQNLAYSDYYKINYLIIFPLIIILFGFYFLMNLNLKYEKKINQLVEELTLKNSSLEQKKEEILTQLDEISEQKATIENAYKIIEIKNKNITDSIIYAERIQSTILKSNETFKLFFNDSFIFFKPRDIVSGDFYFIKKFKNNIYLAAADCTGHGVPGAFMSILGITLINEIVQTKEIYNSAQILDELRNQIKYSLKQSGEKGEQQDGMDIAFCVFNIENLEMSFAGAHNPCWIFRNPEDFENPQGFTLIELQSDHQPIGIYLKEKPFTDQKFQLQKDDILYLFSDGFESQFGGEKNEKFKKKRLKNLFSEICHLPLTEQKLIIENKFSGWKENNEQTDDVLVIGVKI